MTDLPVVRLKPKANVRAIRHGFPWVYANELVTDRRTKALTPGALAVLEDAERNALALVTVNPNSKIMARVLDRDTSVQIDRDWIRKRIVGALALRERLYDRPFYRLVHAEADGFPGLVIDRFGDACVVQPNAAWIDARLGDLTEVLGETLGVNTVLKNASGRARVLEGLDEESQVIFGSAPEAPIDVEMNGATYMADLTGGQKTGLFFDQRPNHAFAASLSKGARVLDVFSHVGGFSLAALAGGAASAMAVDGSAAAPSLAANGAPGMGGGGRFDKRQGDAFDVLEARAGEGAPCDGVICDPPAFAPNKASLPQGLRAYERVARLAAPLVAPGGWLVLCSCSHAADPETFRRVCANGIRAANRRAQLVHSGRAGPDHPQHPYLAENSHLKAVFFRMLDA